MRLVPQAAQWVRRTPGEETWLAGAPVVQAKAARPTVAQATLGAPAARRQVAQWQIAASAPAASIR